MMMMMKVTMPMTTLTTMPPTVCSSSSASPASPFLCLDIIYVSVLLEDLGFPPHKTLKVSSLNLQGYRSGSAPLASDPDPSLCCSWPGPSRGWRPAGLWAPPSTTSPRCTCTRPEVTFDLVAASFLSHPALNVCGLKLVLIIIKMAGSQSTGSIYFSRTVVRAHWPGEWIQLQLLLLLQLLYFIFLFFNCVNSF